MTSKPIALIFGFGKNVGTGVAKAFSAKGYKIATVSRSTSPSSTSLGYLHIQGDLSDPTSISSIFSTVRKELGQPSVVIYNGASNSHMNKTDPLSISLEDAIKDLNINTLSTLAAAKEATKSFATLPSSAARTFVFTGNIQNSQIIPPLMSSGIGKSATAHILESAATAYKDIGYK
jgi:NAD(P)-dependent dehydrogenase (short-subunit alcohol dehydrogenase family)